MQKAWGTFEVKRVNAEQRVIEGIASTPTPDRGGDIMVPEGAEFALPLPFLWFHDTESPIGEVFEATVKPEGIYIKARVSKVTEPGRLKTLCDEAWAAFTANPPLVRGLSIGWKPKDVEGAVEQVPGTSFIRFWKWVWGELSAVTVPMNVEATILSVKQAASGQNPPGDSGTSTVVRVKKDAPPMTNQELITGLENKRAASYAAAMAIQNKAAAEGRTKDDQEKEQFSTLMLEVKACDAELSDARDMERLAVKAATPVTGVTDTKSASDVRGAVTTTTPRVQIASMLPKGTAFTRYAMAIAASRGSKYEALEYAKQWESTTPEVLTMLKAAVAAGTTTTSGFMAELAVQQPQNDFIELLRPKTLLGRIPNLRRAPFNVSVPAQTAGGTYAWVGQGAPKPLTSTTTATVTLGITKIAGIIVLTEELVKISSPSAEEMVRNEMIAGITKYMDEQFIDPSVAASGTTRPASITNGTSAVTSAGTSADNALTDIKALFAAFLAANLSTANAVLIMSEANLFALMVATNALGAPLFQGLQGDTPRIFGVPVIASQSAGTTIALVDAQGILVADDGGVSIDVSREATLEMSDAPTATPDASTVYVSLFQMNLVGLRAERFVNYKRARTASVKYVAQTYV